MTVASCPTAVLLGEESSFIFPMTSREMGRKLSVLQTKEEIQLSQTLSDTRIPPADQNRPSFFSNIARNV